MDAFESAGRALFNLIDADGSGTLDKQEMLFAVSQDPNISPSTFAIVRNAGHR